MSEPLYRTIVADPPWAYPEGFVKTKPTGRSMNRTLYPDAIPGTRTDVTLPYPSMSLVAIKDMRVRDLADSSGCRLWLWTTNKYLRDAFDVMEAWGFKYGQTLVWHKLGGTPWASSVAPNSAEFILTGTIGSPGRMQPWKSAVEAHGVPKRHSRKPERFTDLIEQASPEPRIELFARSQRMGWDVWGNEVESEVELIA